MTVADLDAVRRARIGGSEAPAVCGVDPFRSPFRLAAEKLGLVPPAETSEVMRLGQIVESAHLVAVAEAGWEVVPPDGREVTHARRKWQVCHPDGYTFSGDASGILELKLRGTRPEDEDWFPYIVQATHNMDVCGLPFALISVIHGGYGGVRRAERVVEYDKALAREIRTECEIFRRLLRRGEEALFLMPAHPGEPRDLYPEHVASKALRANTAVLRHVEEARRHKGLRDYHRDEYERHAAAIQAYMRDAHELHSRDDQVLAKWTRYTSQRLDTTLLRAAHPEIASEFTTARPSQRFEVM